MAAGDDSAIEIKMEDAMTSYETLADAAFAAAVDVQLVIEGKASSLDSFKKFASLLKEPISPDSSYKLLYDARNLPLYKAAWLSACDPKAIDLKSEQFLQRVADLLQRAQDDIENGKTADKQRIADFCLALNRVFLEENAKNFESAYGARAYNAAS
jgi:DICT domain-containing protein